MKKILAIVLSVAMILSLSVVIASAAPGKFQAGEENFTPVGDMKVAWDAEASEKIDVTDGDMQDWVDAGYTLYTISPENMVSWVDVNNAADPATTSMPDGWNLTAYFVADSDYLYIGFYIKDDDVILSDDNSYNGDSFQLSIDFDNILGQSIEADPDSFDVTTMQCVFYSFGLQSTEKSPICITVQNTDGDRNGVFHSGDDTGVIVDDETVYDEVADILGSTNTTETGWCAEFAISWNQFYTDLTYKTYSEESKFYVGEGDNLDLSCGLYYLNYDTVTNDDGSTGKSGVTWAAGTLKGQEPGTTPEVTWSPADNGMMMYLEWFQGMEINCDGVIVLAEGETIPPVVEETEAEETEAPATNETVADATDDTAAEEGTAAGGETSADAATEATKAEGGCASVIGAAAVLFAAMAAAVVLKKKD